MKVFVSEECIGCGVCESTAPEIFAIGDEGIAVAASEDVPEDAEDMAQEAADSCPTGAIELE